MHCLLITPLFLAAARLAASDLELPLSADFMADEPSGDRCTIAIDQQPVDIALFTQKPVPKNGVQTDTMDWGSHMPRVGAGSIENYRVEVEIFSSRDRQQRFVHVLMVRILDAQGARLGSLGANQLRSSAEVGLSKALRTDQREMVDVNCEVGTRFVEKQ